MMKSNRNYLKLKLNNYVVDFSANNSAGYKTEKAKKILRNTLLEISRGYCMYCYTRIAVDKKAFSNLEHSIEKSKNGSKLSNCRMNVSICCPLCNTKFKKKNESNRIKSIVKTREYADFNSKECDWNSCISMCKEYIDLRKRYNKSKYGHIILQPYDSLYKECVIDDKEGRGLYIEYDLIEGKFGPDSDYNYTEEEKQFINSHIGLFCLNDINYRTDEIYKFCDDFINNPSSREMAEKYDNYLVLLFVENVSDLSNADLRQLCITIYKCGMKIGRI